MTLPDILSDWNEVTGGVDVQVLRNKLRAAKLVVGNIRGCVGKAEGSSPCQQLQAPSLARFSNSRSRGT